MTESVRSDSPTPANDNSFAAGVGVNDATGSGSTQGDLDGGEATGEGSEKFLTQEQHERSLKNRLARQERKLREELQQQAQEEARKSRMDEVERLRVEREEAINSSKAMVQKANERIMLSEAKAQAAALGVPQESLKYISRLVDLSDVDVDSNGDYDEDALVGAVQQVLKDVPALVKSVASEDAGEAGAQSNGQSLVMPMGRDRSPDVSRGNSSGSGGPSAKDIFNQRLRQRSSQR